MEDFFFITCCVLFLRQKKLKYVKLFLKVFLINWRLVSTRGLGLGLIIFKLLKFCIELITHQYHDQALCISPLCKHNVVTAVLSPLCKHNVVTAVLKTDLKLCNYGGEWESNPQHSLNLG